ncbi:MAG TPA: LamG-like jellyroll fold domain-containing protein [Verrucomicrobiales bacterium]|nr:LamG-like jellyroll fold domain-containing protein [Verrucomicrobiales bacterium]
MRILSLLAAALVCSGITSRAADPVISEFMADNSETLADQDGQYSDWIEVFNPGPGSVDLLNWSLTDDKAILGKWKFPAQTLNAGQSVVVFASGKDRAVGGSQLHTNFSLNDNGDYLALVKPDGVTKTSEWDEYPPQKSDVSFGTVRQNVTTAAANGAGKAYIPSGGTGPSAAWNTAAYAPDASWIDTVAPPGIGYDTSVAPPAPTNIAPTGTASQSTTNGAFTPNLATDGIATNFTHTLGTDSAAFWNLDFGNNATINSITVRNRGDGCCGSRLRDITISILDATFTPVWTSALLNPENTGFVFPAGPASLTVDLVALTGGPVTGRHVRVSRTPDPDGSGAGGAPGTVDEQNVLSMGEVEVMGFAPFSLVNLARTGSPLPTAAQTSTLGTFTAALAINGSNADFSHTLNTDTNPAWTVNLNRRGVIYAVNMHNRESCCPDRLRNVTVQILGTDGTTVVHTSALLNPNNSLSSPPDLNYDVTAANGGNPILGQYVRIKRTPDAAGTDDNARVLSLGEVQVRGTELNGYRPFIRSDIQTAMKDNSPTAYLRLPFSIADASAVTGLSLKMRYDDGFVAYVNGTLVASRNAPAGPNHNSTANSDRTFADVLAQETIDISSAISALTTGSNNVLAIHGLNSSAGDDNFLIQPELSVVSVNTVPNVYLTTSTPGATNNTTWYLDEVADTVFSSKRGFYDAAFNLALTTATAGAQIVYTLNNSEPTLTNGITYSAPIPISATSVVRARAFKTNWKSTNTDTHTYIFLNDVTNPAKGTVSTGGAASGTIPAGWPNSAATNGGQAFNFGFDAGVKALYTQAQMREALTQIPTISLVTQQNNLTDPATGIYVNGVAHGDAWERPASVEMLDYNNPRQAPDTGNGEFAENCGIRIRGGASRGDSSTKHSFRVFFRKAYGNGKLSYRLYGADGAADYENFDLRGSQNYSWSQNASDTNETMVRDPFCRMTLAAMGQPSTRTRYCHLFLNGLYWGIFDIHERADNSFGETYLGGDKDDYDGIKCGDRYTLNFQTEATDGYLTQNPDGSISAWKDLWDRSVAFRANPTNANYFRMLGRNPDGSRNPAWPVLVDVDDIIDYMMVIFYSGDGDAVLSNFLSNNMPNNWFSLRDRMGDRGFTFYLQDGEHTLLAPSWNVDRTGPWLSQSNSSNFAYSNPQWIHDSLSLNAEYRLRFADHVRKHFFNGGAMSAPVAKQRWLDKAATINKAIRAYAARYSNTATGETAWTARINNVRDNFFDSRPAIVLAQFQADGLWPALAAPDYSQHGGAVAGGYQLTITAPAGAQIYYTTDGTDPRALPTAIPTPLTYAALNASTRYRVTTAASGGDNGFSSVPSTPPNPGPVSRYALNGDANDAVGGNNGTPLNSPVFSSPGADGTGQCITLNGTNQAINLGNPANLQILGPITMAAWIKPTDVNALRNILNKGHNTVPSGEITLRINTGALLGAGSWNGSDHIASLSGAATPNVWQHVCGVYNGTQWILYKNGAQIAAVTDATGAVAVNGSTAANNVWHIGSRGGTPTERPFAGQIDDVVIYNRGLTPTEVLALYSPTVISADWKEPAYAVPASWGTATGGIGYDTKAVPTFNPYINANVQPSMQGVSTTLLTRKDFTLTAGQIADTGLLQLNVRYDDGFIAYLNGVKVAERNAPSGIISGTSASTAVRLDTEAIIQEKINITAFKNSLVAGNNVLAIQALNTTAADTDCLLETELVAADVATTNAVLTTPGAHLYTGPVTLNSSAAVNARVYLNGTWSALTQAFFSVSTEPASANNIVISEINYNPTNPVSPAELAVTPDKDEYEYIEVMNIRPSTNVDLTGVRFTAGITTVALGNQILAPGERAIFVKNEAAFNVRYAALNPAPRILGVYSGSLNNQGEQIVLNASGGAIIRDFVFDDNAPWPEPADGAGMSLTLIAPLTNPDHSLPQNWRGSATVNGTPGGSDATSYASWKTSNGVGSDTEDLDRDGLSALLEYALGTPPGTTNGGQTVTGVSQDGLLTISLTHSASADDVRLVPEVSTNLNTWSAAGVTNIGSIRNADGSVTTMWKAPVTAPVPARVFLHIRAELR